MNMLWKFIRNVIYVYYNYLYCKFIYCIYLDLMINNQLVVTTMYIDLRTKFKNIE